MTDQHAELELAHHYAAGRLDPAAALAFEEHLLMCEECRTEVRLGVGLRKIVRATPASGLGHPGRWVAGLSALFAAGIAFFILASGADRKVAALGRVQEPPAYIGMIVRSLPGRGDSSFDAAMTAYMARNYDAAAASLKAALAAGVDTIPAEFFMASAQLMAGHPSEAEAGYARVIAAGPAATAYLAEARLYRARALLRIGRADEALAELAAVDPADVVNAARAAALADSVTRVIRR